jgi:hypothetical protein
MAEVLTYKCDVCGKVYHVDGDNQQRMVIVNNAPNDEKHYNHICPKCIANVECLLKNPDECSNREAKLNTVRRYAYRLEYLIKDISDSVCGCRCWYGFNESFSEPEYEFFKDAINDVKKQYNKINKLYKIWMVIGYSFIGAFIMILLESIL